MRHSAESIFDNRICREYEFIFETALAHESGDPGVLFAEETEGRKSRDTAHLTDIRQQSCEADVDAAPAPAPKTQQYCLPFLSCKMRQRRLHGV
jgi:hypothetical protein